jgi:YidC/Oxa1 family membrane protein insertase
LDSGDVFNVPEPLDFAGVYNKYFAFLLRPDSALARRSLSSARYEPVHPLPGTWPEDRPSGFVRTVLPLKLSLPAPGETSETYRYLVYAGPKLAEEIEADHRAHELVLESDLSTFSSIGHVLLVVLGFFHRLTGNWGWSIILLTICVRGALFPLNRRSQTAMARYQNKMRRVQPKLEEIKRRFANDPQKQREAQARLMQEEGAFPPLGGCLPMLLQIPIFFGLFSALRTSPDLRQAPFMLWVKDLARPDRLLELDLTLPLLPDVRYLNLLPLLMVVLWILQQRGMPKPADEQQAKMQRMMAFMPIVFGFMLYNYAAGLSLYMITTASMSILEHGFIKKRWPVKDDEPEKKKPGCGPFSGILQNLADKQAEHMMRVQAMLKSAATKKKAGKRKR